MNWVQIAGKTAKLAASVLVQNTPYSVAFIVYDAVSIVLNGYQPPYSVLYSNATEGYLKIWVTGDLYQRTILISDNLNRVSGYAYYDWGGVEQLKSKSNMMAKWPVSVRPGGYTYNYEYATYTSLTWNYATTPGFYGNTTLYQAVINLYQNTMGYFTHMEKVNVNSAIASLVGS